MTLHRALTRIWRRLTAPAREALEALDDPGARRDCPGHACAQGVSAEKSGQPGTSR